MTRKTSDFLRRVQLDGTVKQQADEMITLQITVTAEQETLIHRLTEVLSARGHVPTKAEVIMIAVDKLLDQRDQLRRATKMAAKDAERALVREPQLVEDQIPINAAATERFAAARQRDEDRTSASQETVAETAVAQDSPVDEQSLLPRGSQTREQDVTGRRRIPEVLKRAVFRRAEGRCQHLMPDGSRCGEMRMVEIDHIIPVARGGRDEESNLTLVCREHNQYRARLIMGDRTMDQYR